MGAEDIRRQALNVQRMKLLGNEILIGNKRYEYAQDAMNEAMRDWVAVDSTYYLVSSAAGPQHPEWCVTFSRLLARRRAHR